MDTNASKSIQLIMLRYVERPSLRRVFISAHNPKYVTALGEGQLRMAIESERYDEYDWPPADLFYSDFPPCLRFRTWIRRQKEEGCSQSMSG